MARKLGEKEIVELLDKNLRQEKEALKKVETISKQILTETSSRTAAGTKTSDPQQAARSR